MDRNAAIRLVVLGVSLTITGLTGWWWALFAVPLAFLVITEFLYFNNGIAVYSHPNRVRRAYEWFDVYLDGSYGEGRDLTEAFFDGDATKPYAKALEDKFERFIELLGLKSGDTLLDVGCGYGDFISHLENRGIEAHGITLSAHQAKVCQARGLQVVQADFKHLPERFVGKYDAVTFLGCLEHFGSYVTSPDRSVHDRLLQRTFQTACSALRPDSRVRRVFTSTIHETKLNPKGVDWVHGYLIERHYSGLYPRGDDGLVNNSRAWFNELYRYDASDDYRLASEVDALHFGNFRIQWNLKRLAFVPLLILLDPFWMHKWLYHGLGSWMWQFGGVGGLPKSERPVTLWWFLLHAKAPNETSPAETSTS